MASSVENRIGIVAFVYFLLAMLPAALLLFSLTQAFSVLEVLLLVCILTMTASA